MLKKQEEKDFLCFGDDAINMSRVEIAQRVSDTEIKFRFINGREILVTSKTTEDSVEVWTSVLLFVRNKSVTSKPNK